VITIPQRYRGTDRQADEQTTCCSKRRNRL